MKPATLVTTILLVLVALVHVLRLMLRVEVTVGAAVVPMWASALAIIVPAALAVGLWRENAAPRS
jgi:hypothetical protein